MANRKPITPPAITAERVTGSEVKLVLTGYTALSLSKNLDRSERVLISLSLVLSLNPVLILNLIVNLVSNPEPGFYSDPDSDLEPCV